MQHTRAVENVLQQSTWNFIPTINHNILCIQEKNTYTLFLEIKSYGDEEFCHFTQITLHTIIRFYNDFWTEIIVLFCYVARETRLLVFFFFFL